MKKILFILISFTLLTVVGCKKDFLDTRPSESVSGGELFSSISGADILITGTNRLRFLSERVDPSVPHYNFGERAYELMMDGICEDLYETGAGGWYTERGIFLERHWKNDNDAPNVKPWNHSYRIINNVNQLIDNVDLIQDGSQDEKDFWLAQALIYRAHYHHFLVQIYAKPFHSDPDALGVPINIKAVNDPMPRSKVRDVYTQIFADLHQAETLLEGNPVVPRDKSFANLNVVYGLLARAYSCTGKTEDWPKVEEYANLAKQNHALMTKDEFRGGFFAANSEWMWASFVPSDELTEADVCSRMIVNGIGYTSSWGYRNCVSHKVFDHADVNDARFYGTNNGDQPMTQNYNLGLGTDISYNKFYIPMSQGADLCYMRSAEMYLLEAEAQIMQGKFGDARTNLQDLMDARTTGYDATSFANADLLAEIKMQRRLEFWGEGKRFFDLKRWGEGFDRAETGVDIVMPPYVNASRIVIDPTDPFWVFKIPRAEMDANELMVQNN